jgi:hypothetical protein
MSRSTGPARGFAGLTVLAILIAVIALPALAADPSASPSASSSPAATAAPAATAKPSKAPKPDKAAKPEKGPETDVTLTGTVGTRTDADGRTEYTLTTTTKTVVLEAGPPWFFGDNHPLKAYVGKKVTITGTQRAGADEVEVTAVDGKAIRAAGKPPWAGGWKRVGAKHPGWTQEKWDRWQTRASAKAKALGVDCFPPGLCKDKPGKPASSGDDKTGADAGG